MDLDKLTGDQIGTLVGLVLGIPFGLWVGWQVWRFCNALADRIDGVGAAATESPFVVATHHLHEDGVQELRETASHVFTSQPAMLAFLRATFIGIDEAYIQAAARTCQAAVLNCPPGMKTVFVVAPAN